MTFKTPAGAFHALAPVTLSIPQGRFVSLIGPSGCGKSTIFNIIAGLLEPTGGRVLIDGVDATGTIGRVGYMLQKDLLLPWRTVLDNVILGMEIQGVPLREARERALAAAAALRAVRLRISLSELALRRHAPARGAVAHAAVRHRRHSAGRAVRRARRADQAADAGMADAVVERLRQDRAVRHPRRRGGDLSLRRAPRDGHAPGPHHRDHPGHAARPRVRTSALTPEFLAIKERCLELLARRTTRLRTP